MSSRLAKQNIVNVHSFCQLQLLYVCVGYTTQAGAQLYHHSESYTTCVTCKLCMSLAARLVLNAALVPPITSLCVWLLSGSASLVLVVPDSHSSAASRAPQPHQASAAPTPTEATLLYSTHNSSQRIFRVLIILRAEIHDALLQLKNICHCGVILQNCKVLHGTSRCV